jgi:hypothetical protein
LAAQNDRLFICDYFFILNLRAAGGVSGRPVIRSSTEGFYFLGGFNLLEKRNTVSRSVPSRTKQWIAKHQPGGETM